MDGWMDDLHCSEKLFIYKGLNVRLQDRPPTKELEIGWMNFLVGNFFTSKKKGWKDQNFPLTLVPLKRDFLNRVSERYPTWICHTLGGRCTRTTPCDRNNKRRRRRRRRRTKKKTKNPTCSGDGECPLEQEEAVVVIGIGNAMQRPEVMADEAVAVEVIRRCAEGEGEADEVV